MASSKVSVQIDAVDGSARATTITTHRGTIETPVFMPVGTRGAVKTLDTADMENLDTQILLANTYHMMERPGAELVEKMGGLHGFMDWQGHTLTDSGGYQIFSLEPKITEEGARFRSVYDGSYVDLSPERSVDVQQKLGADIAMVLDVCPALPSTDQLVQDAMERTLRWAERSKAAHSLSAQAQFGIVQGGVSVAMRAESAKRTVDIGFDGYAIGGLSVGESRESAIPAMKAALAELPADQPRYFMGLGDPVGLIEAVYHGIDMFDCVLPTRLARHGTALSSQGRLNLRNLMFAEDDGPIDAEFDHPMSSRYSRAYLRHLLVTKEPTAGRILTLHNLAWLADFTRQMRVAIIEQKFSDLRRQVWQQWEPSKTIVENL